MKKNPLESLEELKKQHKFYLYVDFKTSEIARYCRVSTRTIRKWLSGKAVPTPKNLEKLQEYLKTKTE